MRAWLCVVLVLACTGPAVGQVRTQADENALVRNTLTNHFRDIENLKREIVTLSSTIEVLRREIAGIRGVVEVQTNDIGQIRASTVNPAYVQSTGQLVEQLSQQLPQQLKALDDRLKMLEPIRVTYDGIEFMVSKDERRDFDAALSAFKAADYARAKELFTQFLGRFSSSGYVPSGQFWLASALYGLGECRPALPLLDAVTRFAPATFTKLSESMLLLANCHAELKDPIQQRFVLEQVVSRFPASEAARLAAEKLRSIQ